MPGKFRCDQAGTGGGGGEQWQVFRIVEKREIAAARTVERPDIFDGLTEIGAIARRSAGGLGDSRQGKRPCPLEETWMFHQILSGERRDTSHDAKP
jgi:hypothetical protein